MQKIRWNWNLCSHPSNLRCCFRENRCHLRFYHRRWALHYYRSCYLSRPMHSSSSCLMQKNRWNWNLCSHPSKLLCCFRRNRCHLRFYHRRWALHYHPSCCLSRPMHSSSSCLMQKNRWNWNLCSHPSKLLCCFRRNRCHLRFYHCRWALHYHPSCCLLIYFWSLLAIRKY